MLRNVRIADYACVAADGCSDNWRLRALFTDLPRKLFSLPSERRPGALREPPELTGTPWDAMLAGLAEYLAHLHGQPAPAWSEEPRRFLDRPWVFASGRLAAQDALLRSPAEFARHGAFASPDTFDRRMGETRIWIPARHRDGPYGLRAGPRRYRSVVPPAALAHMWRQWEADMAGDQGLDRERILQALAALAQFERDLTSERTKAAAARKKRRAGRPLDGRSRDETPPKAGAER